VATQCGKQLVSACRFLNRAVNVQPFDLIARLADRVRLENDHVFKMTVA
jgi:hypothetical protein